MLPNLSDKWGASLQVMLPSTSESVAVSTRRNALLELRKVDSIRVSGSGKGSSVRYGVEVTLSEFKTLANELHGIVNSAHSGQRCEFCSAVLNWYVFGENPDGFLLRFVGSERVARKLTKFLEDLLALSIKYTLVDAQGCCSGHMSMPQVVHKFLFNPPTCDTP
ncbi:hypothetical protein PHYSODRAFT_495189 [Phytophthora sojae]|uniref:Uncharacterized protein n=1 Tax=Phytophthora sojae (strain P6497) TaxID=1094619 RepID=G4ZBE5_PHYSP|nr:hypothetical protein PHYSODRAFT_495189 [Phytophthora sojae]EGZ22741.1 hypothetical protein PHYSODRAFT_495189 [Phytophthora sojae]|eukprot:XP_009525458.1 hypothetical protein PHYSODRAFT_495189 [Phytophthora sojae]